MISVIAVIAVELADCRGSEVDDCVGVWNPNAVRLVDKRRATSVKPFVVPEEEDDDGSFKFLLVLIPNIFFCEEEAKRVIITTSQDSY